MSTPVSWTLAAGGTSAHVSEIGGALQDLSVAGRPLVVAWGSDAVMPLHRGAVLAPWPNRVGDGTYRFAGADQQLALSEPERHNAIHGLGGKVAWRAESSGPGRLSLTARIVPQQGYPHRLDLVLDYAVDDAGLTWSLAATNAGDTPAPYGCSVHPYLHAGAGGVDDWTLEMPASRRLEVDQRLLPTQLVDVGGSVPDFRSARALRGLELDHAYTGLQPTDGDEAVARVRTASGSGVALRWSASALPWVQVHTADRPEPENNRVGLALEPMSCPPDAFSTGTDVITLAPGATHRATWRIESLD